MVDIPTVPVSSEAEEDRFETLAIDALALHHDILLDKLQELADGKIRNLMVLMPPGSAKSTYVDVVFVPWFMARQDRRNVILTSYGSDLARKQGRRARQLVRSKSFGHLFPGVTVSQESSAADEWSLTNGSEYMAGGILSGVTGNRADLLVVDDPVKGREEAESETIRKKTRDAYIDDLQTRLKPGGRTVVIQCMVGETPVLMADGSEKALSQVCIGDEIATLENGRVSTAKVLNWANQGSDFVYEIRMISGITVKANERHPFLVERDGKQEWIRLRDLQTGDAILRAKARGQASLVPMPSVASQHGAKASANPTIKSSNGLAGIAPHPHATRNASATSSCAIDTELARLSMMQCSPSKAAFAQSVSERHPKAPRIIGAKPFASIIATTPEQSGGCSAIAATSLLDGDETSPSSGALSNIYSIDRDFIQSIRPCGREDVFDIQVEGTENFIANGLISHNTRWHADDLAGGILPENWSGESGVIRCRDGQDWYVLAIPAKASKLNDPLGRKVGEYLWPEWFDADHWAKFEANPRTWSSLFQQVPSPEEGTYFQRAWFKRHARKPEVVNTYITSDYAVTEGGGDYTEHAVWGLDPDNRLFMLDWWHGQTSSDVWIERLLDLIERWKPMCCFGEKGVIEKAVRPQLDRRMMERRVYARMEWLPSIADKATRARSFQSRAAMGLVSLPETEDGERVLSQLLTFPAGKYDDAVDVCSLMGAAIDQAHSGIAMPANERSLARSGYAPASDTGGASWRT